MRIYNELVAWHAGGSILPSLPLFIDLLLILDNMLNS